MGCAEPFQQLDGAWDGVSQCSVFPQQPKPCGMSASWASQSVGPPTRWIIDASEPDVMLVVFRYAVMSCKAEGGSGKTASAAFGQLAVGRRRRRRDRPTDKIHRRRRFKT